MMILLSSTTECFSGIGVAGRFHVATQGSMMVIAFSFLSWLSTRNANIDSPLGGELC